MPRGRFGLFRFTNIGPFVRGYSQNRDAFRSDSEVQRVAFQMLKETPGELREASFNDFFSDPIVFIDFFLPSANPGTITREHFTSSLTAGSEKGRISEMSIRFPAINVSDVDLDKLDDFIESIKSNPNYEVRTQVHDSIEEGRGEPEYHPHIHHSRKKTGIEGPPLKTEASKINNTIKEWYSGIGDVLE